MQYVRDFVCDVVTSFVMLNDTAQKHSFDFDDDLRDINDSAHFDDVVVHFPFPSRWLE